MKADGFLGIDIGTQGLSVVLADEQMQVIAMAEGGYDMVDGLPDGCYEQDPMDWIRALSEAMQVLRRLAEIGTIHCIGISGQMHGEVLVDQHGDCIGTSRLWCDRRNEEESQELTGLLGVKMPKRVTSARWLWTLRHQQDRARSARHITTPAGWIAWQLTNQWNLGVGDASGMFPILPSTRDYDPTMLATFASISTDAQVTPLSQLLPRVRLAGDDGGVLSERGASMMGLPAGIPVSPAEGDQPAALAGSLIGDAGQVSMSFGTSVCANSVGNRPFQGVHRAVDHFCAPDGKPINMICLTNGTAFMNTVVTMCGASQDREAFQYVMPELIRSQPDCGGILAFPFMDDEPGLGVLHGGTAMLLGLTPENATPGNAAKAALLAATFNLRLGCQELDRQGFPRECIILSGGLTRTPAVAQVISDVFDTPVELHAGAEEGTAIGAALMAKYRFRRLRNDAISWSDFLASHRRQDSTSFSPDPRRVAQYEQVFERYQLLFNSIHSRLASVLTGEIQD